MFSVFVSVYVVMQTFVFVVGCNSAKKMQSDDTETENEISSEPEPVIEEFVYEPSQVAMSFKEIWGYVFNGREYEFSSNYPITDVGYFVSAVNAFSELDPVPERNKFFSKYKGRVHLVTSADSRSQTHLLLDPELPLRDRIIDSLIKASETYEGLQIDWELVPAKDKDNFLSFLTEIKKKLNGKILSIAVPARVKTLTEDAYDYAAVSEIVDRVIIMAYDEHWSTSKPGPIASNSWCRNIYNYAKNIIPEEKLVMGVSFYGRTWTDDKDGARAWYNEGINRIKSENEVNETLRSDEGIPYFSFTKTVTITGWYDDVYSLNVRCKMYRDSGVKNLAFWRVGQEDKEFWNLIVTEDSLRKTQNLMK